MADKQNQSSNKQGQEHGSEGKSTSSAQGSQNKGNQGQSSGSTRGGTSEQHTEAGSQKPKNK